MRQDRGRSDLITAPLPSGPLDRSTSALWPRATTLAPSVLSSGSAGDGVTVGARRTAVTDRAADLHPLAWGAWLCAGILMVFLTSNPLYVALILLSALVVYASRRTATRRALDVLLVVGVAIAVVTIPLNLLTGSSGATQLFDLPSVALPGWLASVTLGGPVTAESLVYATTHALTVAAVLALVCAFNVAVDHFKLLKYTPAGLAQLGVIVTISLLLVPETLRRIVSLQEARRVRGHDASLRSVPSLLLPILSEALERSVQRAESLDARGFGRLSLPANAVETLVAVAALTVSAASSFAYYYYPSSRIASVSGMAIGLAGIIVVGLRQARRSGATRLSHERAGVADGVVVVAALAGVVAMLVARAGSFGGVSYLPFPSLVSPQLHVLPVVACLALLAPALTMSGSRS